jgi:Zn-dependent protease with chaperone function
VAGAPAAPARCNPFAFPSNIDFAFGLLVAVVLGTSLLLFMAVSNTIGSGFETQAAQNARCQTAAGPLRGSDTLADRERWLDAFAGCLGRGRPAGVVIGVVALALGAAGIYLLSPRLRIRRSGFVPLDAAETPEVVAELRGLCRVAGVAREPAFLWNPLNLACSGLAFGLPGRRCVAISGGLVTRLWTDPPIFRAVVLHELAHLRNGDVDKAYATGAIWWSFVVTALLPFAVVVPWWDLALLPRRALSLAALVLVVYLLRDAALRARETYADVRASTWSPYADGLERALPSGPPAAHGWRRAIDAARGWFRRHPTAAFRRAAVRDPSPLFATSFWLAAGTGVAGSLSFVAAGSVVDLLVPGAGPWVAALVFAGLVVGVVGLGLWRSAFLAGVRGEPVRGLWRAALGLAAGLAAGDLLAVSAAVRFPDGFALTGAPLVIFDVAWYGLLLGGVALFLRWAVACASAWLPAVAARRSPRLAFLLGAAPSLLVLAVGLEYLFTIAATRDVGGIAPASLVTAALRDTGGLSVPDGPYLDTVVALAYLVLQVGGSPVFYAAMQLLWLLPLGTWPLRRRAAPVAAARWALLDPAPEAGSRRAPRPPQPGRCLAAGLIGGLAFWAVDLPVALFLDGISVEAITFWLVYGQAVLGVLVQIGVAFAVAASIPRLGAVHGLFAAFACGCVVAVAALATVLPTVGTAGLRVEGVVSSTIATYLNVGALLTLPAAIAGAGAASLLRRLAGEPAPRG